MLDHSQIVDIVYKLKPCVFNYKWDLEKKTFGFIAQDLLKFFPEKEFNIVKKNTDEDIYVVDYSQIIPILCVGIHDLQKRVTELEEELLACKK